MLNLHDDPILAKVPTISGLKVLGQHALYGRLGSGGMGAVYLGRHIRLEKDAAIKCLLPKAAGMDEVQVERFWQEARIAANVTSPNLISVSDTNEGYGIHYMVMEYVEGENAQQMTERRGALPVREALTIALEASRGLAAAHSHTQPVIHRDVKPPNIMVGVDGRVMLSDLGIARMETDTLLTAADALFGTPHYMPPEQVEDVHKVTPAADVYSLGATLYYLLTHEPPFVEAQSIAQILDRVRAGFPPFPSTCDSIPESVKELVRRCTMTDPSDRYQDGEELVAAVVQVLNDLGGPVDLRDYATSSCDFTDVAPSRETLHSIVEDRESSPPDPARQEIPPTLVDVHGIPATRTHAGGFGHGEKGKGDTKKKKENLQNTLPQRPPVPRKRATFWRAALAVLILGAGGGLVIDQVVGAKEDHQPDPTFVEWQASAQSGDWVAVCRSIEQFSSYVGEITLEEMLRDHAGGLAALDEQEAAEVREAMRRLESNGSKVAAEVLARLSPAPPPVRLVESALEAARKSDWVEFARLVDRLPESDRSPVQRGLEADQLARGCRGAHRRTTIGAPRRARAAPGELPSCSDDPRIHERESTHRGGEEGIEGAAAHPGRRPPRLPPGRPRIEPR